MQNIELKSRLHDRAKTEKRLEALGARRMWARRQKDTFFAVPMGWLKLRETEDKPPELISYVRSTTSAEPRASDYDVIIVKDPTGLKSLLGRVLPVDKIVEKERTLWIYGHTRVHLDRLDSLGEFLELETVVEGLDPGEARAENERLVKALALDPADFLGVPYRDLLP